MESVEVGFTISQNLSGRADTLVAVSGGEHLHILVDSYRVQRSPHIAQLAMMQSSVELINQEESSCGSSGARSEGRDSLWASPQRLQGKSVVETDIGKDYDTVSQDSNLYTVD